MMCGDSPGKQMRDAMRDCDVSSDECRARDFIV